MDSLILNKGVNLLSFLYEKREISPVEVVNCILSTISKINPRLNAFFYVDEEGALEQARLSESRWKGGEPLGILDGVPCTIKDLVLTKDMPTRKGSRSTPHSGPWEVDAPVVEALRKAGGVILGKTTTSEFGWKGVADSPLTGITRNPWNPSLTPGGSSGGAAVAAALGLGVLHIGSDAGGSVRIPGAFTGVFGMKPTFGYVPQWPASAMGTLSHLGPITRKVEDAALMMDIIGQGDIRDFHSLEPRERSWASYDENAPDIAELSIAYSPTLGYAHPSRQVLKRVEDCVRLFQELGAKVEQLDPGFPDPTDCIRTLWYAGAAGAVDKLPEDKREFLDPGLIKIANKGTRISARDYIEATNHRISLYEKMTEFHRKWDVLITPTLPFTGLEVGKNVPDNWESDDWLTWANYCHPFNLTQQPAISVPCGYDESGLPVGVQIVAQRFNDRIALKVAQIIEHAFPASYPDIEFVLSRK
ncbi:amidase [Fodinicurvata sediminis]|uniref:amidase n=1 Tax=Fodinicurvata sediminis TaxID=1121832 RepID=UPI0003B3B954|nr:amidase [Fodinicurvata sediminis]